MRKLRLGLIVGIMVLSTHGAFGESGAGEKQKPLGSLILEKPIDKSELESKPAAKPQLNLLNPKYRHDKGVLVSQETPSKPKEVPSKEE